MDRENHPILSDEALRTAYRRIFVERKRKVYGVWKSGGGIVLDPEKAEELLKQGLIDKIRPA